MLPPAFSRPDLWGTSTGRPLTWVASRNVRETWRRAACERSWYLDPPFGCQISAPNGLFLMVFWGPNFRLFWRIPSVSIYFALLGGQWRDMIFQPNKNLFTCSIKLLCMVVLGPVVSIASKYRLHMLFSMSVTKCTSKDIRFHTWFQSVNKPFTNMSVNKPTSMKPFLAITANDCLRFIISEI